MISPIALKVQQLFPLPNNPGTGAGGLTNNYKRQEDRTVARDNYDMQGQLEPRPLRTRSGASSAT